MNRKGKRIALIAPEPAIADRIPKHRRARVFDKADPRILERWEDVIVLVSWAYLESVAAFIREANERGTLRCILLDIEQQPDIGLLPVYLNHVRMRNLRNLFVHRGPELPNRVINAYCIGAEGELIADAVAIGDGLFVVSCSADAYTVPFIDIAALRHMPESDRGKFRVAEDGSHVAWPKHDVHLDLESIRSAADEEYRLQQLYLSLSKRKRFGRAVAQLREDHDLRQTDFVGLSERQLRRIEHGESGSLKSIRLLAEGHGMSVNRYLNAVAALASPAPLTVRDSGVEVSRLKRK